MKLLVFILFFALILAIPFLVTIFLQWREETDRERTGAEDPRARSIRLNHAAMARLLDYLITDDMTRVMIPEDRQETAKQLLDRYYEEGATK